MGKDNSGWVVIAEYTNHPQASLAENLLRSFDIPVRVWSDDCGGLAGGQTCIQRVRLSVPISHWKEAGDVLGKVPKYE